ncbi:hypothetical protein BDN71DRAFT_283474 [Pleurotus eryngii]|uniref:Uncharacterized protein n=1 Tax=Pleurotus eryngii TaxID=5323 RepID=A0A9P5ZLQ6_PLEER|nr:hypothetical protein BDN71DRAFT_283474 [Pleurotus eryngii]
MDCDPNPSETDAIEATEDDAGTTRNGDDQHRDSVPRLPLKAWRSFRLLVVSTAGATRAAPYRFLLVGNDMIESELVELKSRVLQGWKTWFPDATFKPCKLASPSLVTRF